MGNYIGYKIVGLYFGYPKCCIKAFVERAQKIDAGESPKKTLSKNQNRFSNGFIPCPNCAEKVKPGQEHLLLENRYCEKPFANQCIEFPNEELKRKILKENLEFCLLDESPPETA